MKKNGKFVKTVKAIGTFEAIETVETDTSARLLFKAKPRTSQKTPKRDFSWEVDKGKVCHWTYDWLLESIVSHSKSNHKDQLCKIVERNYIKDPWTIMNTKGINENILHEDYLKRSIQFDADGYPFRINYYDAQHRLAGIGQPKFLADSGVQLKAEELQTDESGRKTYWGVVYDVEGENTWWERCIYEYFYEYKDDLLFRKVQKIYSEKLYFDFPVRISFEMCFDHLGLIQSGYMQEQEYENFENELHFKHTCDESGDVIRTDITLNGKFVISVCRKYYYNKI